MIEGGKFDWQTFAEQIGAQDKVGLTSHSEMLKAAAEKPTRRYQQADPETEKRTVMMFSKRGEQIPDELTEETIKARAVELLMEYAGGDMDTETEEADDSIVQAVEVRKAVSDGRRFVKVVLANKGLADTMTFLSHGFTDLTNSIIIKISRTAEERKNEQYGQGSRQGTGAVQLPQPRKPVQMNQDVEAIIKATVKETMKEFTKEHEKRTNMYEAKMKAMLQAFQKECVELVANKVGQKMMQTLGPGITGVRDDVYTMHEEVRSIMGQPSLQVDRLREYEREQKMVLTHAGELEAMKQRHAEEMALQRDEVTVQVARRTAELVAEEMSQDQAEEMSSPEVEARTKSRLEAVAEITTVGGIHGALRNVR